MRAAPDVIGPRRSIDRDSSPIEPDEIGTLIARFCPVPDKEPVAVAVSGGGDSMALALLSAAWARSEGREIRTVTVDHRLRPDSRTEAETVGRWLGGRGISHDILSWTDDKPATAIQAAARDARYRLIGAWARTHGIRYVFLGHQLEDQAETLLMRLARDSGIAGLAAMRGMSERDGLRLCRPLLTVPRARLRASLRNAGQIWIEDPSNESPKFARTSYRRLATALEDLGAGAQHLSAIADSFARLDGLMDAAVRRFLGEVGVWSSDGSLSLARSSYAALPEPLAAAVLRRALRAIGGAAQAPRSDRLARAQERLAKENGRVAFTLGYCRVATEGDSIHIRPELGRIPKSFRRLPIAI